MIRFFCDRCVTHNVPMLVPFLSSLQYRLSVQTRLPAAETEAAVCVLHTFEYVYTHTAVLGKFSVLDYMTLDLLPG